MAPKDALEVQLAEVRSTEVPAVIEKIRALMEAYPNRETAATDVFDYIEMFYNQIFRHGSAGYLITYTA